MATVREASRRFDRSAFALGLPLGPALLLGGYVALTATDLMLEDDVLLALAAWPVVPPLLAAVVLPSRRAWWLSVALGCAVGTVFLVVVVLGLITGIAALLSDPAGSP